MESTRGVPIQFRLAVLSLAVAPLTPFGLLAADQSVGPASPKPRPVQEKILFDLGKEQVFFRENFEDANLAERGWYDGDQFRIVGGARAGKGCIEYEWTDGQSKVQGVTVHAPSAFSWRIDLDSRAGCVPKPLAWKR